MNVLISAETANQCISKEDPFFHLMSPVCQVIKLVSYLSVDSNQDVSLTTQFHLLSRSLSERAIRGLLSHVVSFSVVKDFLCAGDDKLSLQQ